MTVERKYKDPTRKMFYYEGDLHRIIHISRPKDIVTTWNFAQKKAIKYSYSHIKKHGQRGFSTKDVAKMLNRSTKTLREAWYNGNIKRPQASSKIDGTGGRDFVIWSEKDIMDMHAYLLTLHQGRPRKDGRTSPKPMPTATELRAMIRQNLVMYIQDEKGNFVPTWEAERF